MSRSLHNYTARDIVRFYSSLGLDVDEASQRIPCPATDHPGDGGANCSVRDGDTSIICTCHSHHCPSTDIVRGICRDLGVGYELPEKQPPLKSVKAKSSEQEIGVLPLAEQNEAAIAEELSRRFGDTVKRTPSLGWIYNEGTQWVKDERLATYSLAQKICTEQARLTENPTTRKQMRSARFRSGVAEWYKALAGVTVNDSRFDRFPEQLNTPSYVWNLKTGTFRARCADDYFFHCTSNDPNFDESPVWMQFLEDVFLADQEAIEFVQRWFGYCATGEDAEQKFMVQEGFGANGKTVLNNAIAHALGSYAAPFPIEALIEQKNARHETELTLLRGLRLAMSSEPAASASWNETRMKTLTGGETIQARYMRGDFFTFKPTHKFTVSVNRPPKFRGGDFAMVRRMIRLKFNATFDGKSRDKELGRKLRAEADSILGWLIKGAQIYYREGLRIPASIMQNVEDYAAENDEIQQWLAECCLLDDSDAKTRVSELHQHWNQWRTARGERTWSCKAFSMEVESKGFHKGRINSGAVFAGVRLRAV